MALLANVLATAFAGLFYQESIPIGKATLFSPIVEPKFVSINGSLGPSVRGTFERDKRLYSGAYWGGDGEDHFIVLESNYTQNTPLPPWTDQQAMHLPFARSKESEQLDSTKIYQARTTFISGELVCEPLVPMEHYRLNMTASTSISLEFDSGFQIPSQITNGGNVHCQPYYGPNSGSSNPFPSFASPPSYIPFGERVLADPCTDGPFAGEYVTTLEPWDSSSQEEVETCMSAAVIGWMRMTPNCTEQRDGEENFEYSEIGNAENSLFLVCRPRITMGEATIAVNSDGVLQESAKDRTEGAEPSEENFTTGIFNLFGQANLYMFRSIKFGFHTNPFATEPFHYFTNRAANNDLRFTDPQHPVPKFSDVQDPLRQAYSRLFAIWLGLNGEKLLVPVSNTSSSLSGEILTMEERIFFKTPLFILAEIILGIYVLVAIFVYLKRPGRYLPRMPTTIASQIALFAASAAVEDMKGTSMYTAKERETHLKDLSHQYGYGSYVGHDGSVHVGIERAPFVGPVAKTRLEFPEYSKSNKSGQTGTESLSLTILDHNR
jgi:hypothetical protein